MSVPGKDTQQLLTQGFAKPLEGSWSQEQGRQEKQQLWTTRLQTAVILINYMQFKCQVGCQDNPRGSAHWNKQPANRWINKREKFSLESIMPSIGWVDAGGFISASPALLLPCTSSSGSPVWAGRWSLLVPAAIREEWFPPDHFHTRSQATGTKSWHKSLTPAPSTHPPHSTGMCQPISYSSTLPASFLRRNRVSCAF